MRLWAAVAVALCAVVCAVPVPCCDTSDIFNAISLAVNGQTVVLSDGTYNGVCGFSLGGVTRNVTLTSGGATTVQCSGAAPAFNLTLESIGDVIANITIVGTRSAAGIRLLAGGVTLQGVIITNFTQGVNASGSVQVFDSVITQNSVIGFGAGVSFNSGSLRVSNTMISRNSATGGGAGLYMGSGAVLDARGITIDRNTVLLASGAGGGGLFVSATANATLSAGSVVTNNFACGGAGVSLGSGGWFTMSDGLVQNNTMPTAGCSSGRGGGLFLDTLASVNLYRTHFVSNWAGDQGGAVYLHKGAGGTIDSCNFLDNSAFTGAFVATFGCASNVTLSNATVGRNRGRAVSGAACLNVGTASAWNLTNVVFDDNNPIASAFGIYLLGVDSVFSFTNVTFNNHTLTAASMQALVYVSFGITSTMNNVTFSNNVVLKSVLTASTPTYVGLVMKNNRATLGQPHDMLAAASCIGCIYDNNIGGADGAVLHRGNVTLINCTFTANQGVNAIVESGLWNEAVSISVNTSRFINNIVSSPGASGVVYGDSTTRVFANCLFANNSVVSQDGGVIATYTASSHLTSLTLTDCTFTRNLLRALSVCTASAPGRALVSMTNVVASSNGNTDTYYGGVIAVYGDQNATISLTSVIFANNTGNTGGAMYLQGPFFFNVDYLSGQSVFTGNSATGQGGAVTIMNPTSAAARTDIRSTYFAQNSGARGGAIYIDPGLITSSFTDNVFENNRVANDGGAIFSFEKVTLTRCNVSSNIALRNGGGVLASRLTVTGGSFDHNAANCGGALHSDISILIFDATFTFNTAIVAGAIRSDVALVSTSQFSFNCARLREAGAILALNALTIASSYVANNFAGGAGGAVNTPSLTATNTVFKDNIASENGGAVAVYNFVSITGSSFLANHAARGGAGFFAVEEAHVSNSNLLMNSADIGGGIDTTAVTLSNVTIDRNVASNMGGGIYFTEKLTATKSSFIRNTADSAGGIYGGIQATLTLNDTLVYRNEAQHGAGGGVFISYVAGTINVLRSQFESNTAATFGGGFYLAEANYIYSAQFVSTVFINNLVTSDLIHPESDASSSGGGAFIAGFATFTNGRFITNTAAYGAALTATDTVTMTRVNISRNIAYVSSAVYCQQCSLKLDTNNFTSNTAGVGPAFGCTISSTLDVSGNRFRGNLDSAGTTLVADCSACGCCPMPAHAFAVMVDCLPMSNAPSCQYGCTAGYNASQPALMSCHTVNSPMDAVCSILSCDTALPAPAHGSLTPFLTTAFTGDTQIYDCDAGYRLCGPTSVRCVGPSWVEGPSITEDCIVGGPTCQALPCNVSVFLLSPNGHWIIDPFDTPVTGDTVELMCSVGYRVVGANIVTCSAPGPNWSPNPLSISCTPIPCHALSFNNTAIIPIGLPDVPYTLHCSAGYSEGGMLNGNTSRSFACFNASWIGIPLNCDPMPCEVTNTTILRAENGYLQFNGQNVTGDTVDCVCGPGYAYDTTQSTSATCTGPIWADMNCICQPVLCAAVDQTSRYLTSTCTNDTLHYNTTCEYSCRPGAYGGLTDAVLCDQLISGSQGTLVGQPPACQLCAKGFWSAGNIAFCTPCAGDGTTDDPGAASPTLCLCREGSYEETEGQGDCIGCPAGGYCAGDKHRPVSAPSYFSSGDLQYVLCKPAEACIGNDTCVTGYEGYLCGRCKEGYYRLNGYCLACPDSGWWRILIAVVLGLIAAYALIVVVNVSEVSERSRGFASLNIALSFTQIVATFADLRVNWPFATRAVFQIFSTFNLNIELASPECLGHFDFWQKFQLQMAVPLIAAALMAILWLLWTVALWLKQKRPPTSVLIRLGKQTARNALGAYLFFLTLAYLLLADASFSVFACQEQPNGDYVLNQEPTQKCYKEPWGQNAVAGGLGIVVYAVLIPLIVESIYYRIRYKQGPQLAGRSVLGNYLVKKFRTDRWYWEVVIMARKLLIVIVASFFPENPSVQVASCCAVFFVSCVVTVIFKPYAWKRHNQVEIVCVVASLAVLFCGQMSTSPNYGPVQQAVLGAISVIMIVVAAVVVILCLTLEAWTFILLNRLNLKLHPADTQISRLVGGRVTSLMNVDHAIVATSPNGIIRIFDQQTLDPTMVTDFDVGMGNAVIGAAARGSILAVASARALTLWDLDRRRLVANAPVSADITTIAATRHGIVTGDAAGGVSLWLFRTRESELTAGARVVKTIESAMTADELVAMFEDDNGTSANAPAGPSHTQDQQRTSFAVAGDRASKVTSNPAYANNQASYASAGGGSFTPSAPHVTEDRITCAGHEGGAAVTAVCVTGMFAFSGASDGTIRKWSTEDGSMMREWKLPSSASVTAVASAGLFVWAGTETGSVVLFDAMKSEPVETLRGHLKAVVAITLFGESVCSASRDGSVVLWSAETAAYQQTVHPSGPIPIAALVTVPEINAISWVNDDGVLSRRIIKPEWHIREFDPPVRELARQICGKCCKGKCGTGSDKASGAREDGDVYEELRVLSRDLIDTDAAAPGTPIGWERLPRNSATALRAVLAKESGGKPKTVIDEDVI